MLTTIWTSYNLGTFIGGYFEKGAWPWASSNAVMPKDHISALQRGSETKDQILHLNQYRADILIEEQ